MNRTALVLHGIVAVATIGLLVWFKWPVVGIATGVVGFAVAWWSAPRVKNAADATLAVLSLLGVLAATAALVFYAVCAVRCT